jgi:PKD repeat protein
VAGTYTAQLTVTDNDGGTNTASQVIEVLANQAPTAIAGSDVNSGQVPLSVAFNSDGSGDPDGTASYSWAFGDGGTSTDQDPSHTYTTVGSYSAVLTVTDDNGATATSTVLIEVLANAAPTVTFSATPSSGKAPLVVAFDSTGTEDTDGTITSYAWTFGDGGTSSSASPTHTYNAPGTYTAKLVVTDNKGKTGEHETTISAVFNQPPTSSAQVTPASGKATFTTFNFTSTGSGDPDGAYQLDWDFGDETAHSSLDSPSHVYAAAGNYTVTLKVTAADNGAVATSTVPVTVVNNVAPTAAAQVDATSGKTGIKNFQFGSAGTSDSDGTVTLDWNFGDGSLHSTAASPTHVYSAAGTYTVTLTATDDNGATATDTKTITVVDNVAPSTAPTVNLTSGTAGATTGTAFNFQANSGDSDGTVTAHFWAFDDGTFATTANPSNKRFALPGTYSVTVTVTDNNGAQTTSAPISITVT